MLAVRIWHAVIASEGVVDRSTGPKRKTHHNNNKRPVNLCLSDADLDGPM